MFADFVPGIEDQRIHISLVASANVKFQIAVLYQLSDFPRICFRDSASNIDCNSTLLLGMPFVCREDAVVGPTTRRVTKRLPAVASIDLYLNYMLALDAKTQDVLRQRVTLTARHAASAFAMSTRRRTTFPSSSPRGADASIQKAALPSRPSELVPAVNGSTAHGTRERRTSTR
jgi:hypothetical protein